MADEILSEFQNHPESWHRVDTILENSKSQNTKFLALKILENAIKFRWKSILKEQREAIKDYVLSVVILTSKDEVLFQENSLLLQRLNGILVEILKHEWPHNWKDFIPNIISRSETSETVCENSMILLRLLSEEIFEFSEGNMVQSKITDLKENLNKEFSEIWKLFEAIFQNSENVSLINSSLKTLHVFLSWVPIGYILETQIIEYLSKKYLSNNETLNYSLKCLIEIASIEPEEGQYDGRLVFLFTQTMEVIAQYIKSELEVENYYEKGNDDDREFIQNISLFITIFLRNHLQIVENEKLLDGIVTSLKILIGVSTVNNIEIFKICLDFWYFLSKNLFDEKINSVSIINTSSLDLGSSFGGMGRGSNNNSMNNNNNRSERMNAYSEVLPDVRRLLIEKMAKPEEILIIENELGELIRERQKDTSNIILYKKMSKTLITLTHLDHKNMEQIMLERLLNEIRNPDWKWSRLNTVCWAIGSINGSMTEKQEKRFLIIALKELLDMCENKNGKDNKAVIASNIMYIVGQYPRFLRNHWNFLKTVLNKLFEFMEETHPGVQDMACDTFLKITHNCKKQFVKKHKNQNSLFVEEIIERMPEITKLLQLRQKQVFYETMGEMIHVANYGIQEELIARLMVTANDRWKQIIEIAGTNVMSLKKPNICRELVFILRVNTRVVSTVGVAFQKQLSLHYQEMIDLYSTYSKLIFEYIEERGALVAKSEIIRNMRHVKSQIIVLLQTFISKYDGNDKFLLDDLIPPFLELILDDYKNNIPEAKEASILALITTIVDKLKHQVSESIPLVFDSIFECTLLMIRENFEDYPDHRLNFFKLIREINRSCFVSMFLLDTDRFKLIVDCIVWAFKHTERNMSETGLYTTEELLDNINSNENILNDFYSGYYLILLTDIFSILTDTLHKSGFQIQYKILRTMFMLVKTEKITVYLDDNNSFTHKDNSNLILNSITELFLESFNNLTENQIHDFARQLFDNCENPDKFKTILRDFLVIMKEFSGDDNSDLYSEEKNLELKQLESLEIEKQLLGLKIQQKEDNLDPELQKDLDFF
ncbi:exportin-1 [Anaeramoeba flamelloides]|uniref:Exportin-1 n=1 Tax=Anaeramoeba flamelloides TaxID=1746091 RepID=A0AAV7ZMX8_9EUKA|nr:exportin-1 [Anaeramoeba flamelloides]